MSLKEKIDEMLSEHGNPELMEEFGITHEQAVELTRRFGRGFVMGFKAGVTVTLVVLLMLLGAVAVYSRFLHH